VAGGSEAFFMPYAHSWEGIGGKRSRAGVSGGSRLKFLTPCDLSLAVAPSMTAGHASN
jgi:hypothetical protein